MRTKVTEMFGIDVPIFAFTHCRDVVVEVSRAGGLGVLGAASFSPERLEQELKWIDEHIGGKPYGVDLLLPNKYERVGERKLDLEGLLPAEHRRFVKELADRAGAPPLPAEVEDLVRESVAALSMTPDEAAGLLEVAFRHPIRLLVSALGTPARKIVEAAHARGIKVAALAGKVEHALRHVEAGVDLIVAQGTEAGGHTGSIASMVLWPQVVDAVAPVPVLAAGGVGRGRQLAAALMLGAEGVWCGSVWLGTRQSELSPEMRELFFAAKSEDAVRTRSLTGKPARALRSKFTEAWEQPGAPSPLPLPLQSMLVRETQMRINRAVAREYMTYFVGQIVGDMKGERNVRDVIYDMLAEFAQTAERFSRLVND